MWGILVSSADLSIFVFALIVTVGDVFYKSKYSTREVIDYAYQIVSIVFVTSMVFDILVKVIGE